MKNKRELIYFIQNNHTKNIKIGKTNGKNGLLRRLVSLQVGNEQVLEIIGVIIEYQYSEKVLHKMFNEYRLLGEWFKLNEELTTFIKEKAMFFDDYMEKGYICLEKRENRKGFDNDLDFFNFLKQEVVILLKNHYNKHKDDQYYFKDGFLKISYNGFFDKLKEYERSDVKSFLKFNASVFKSEYCRYNKILTNCLFFKISCFKLPKHL